MVNRILAPKERTPSNRGRQISFYQESFCMAMQVKSVRADLYQTSLVCRSAFCKVHSKTTLGCSWEWHSGYNPLHRSDSRVTNRFFMLCTLHSSPRALLSFAWPERMKVIKKQETVEMWDFLKKNKSYLEFSHHAPVSAYGAFVFLYSLKTDSSCRSKWHDHFHRC